MYRVLPLLFPLMGTSTMLHLLMLSADLLAFFQFNANLIVFFVFLHFQSMVECLFNTKIKQIQTDWGGEFRPLNTFFHKHGIIHRISCPHTHQQQGCVEHKQRHIIDTSLALLAESHIPKAF
jgi:hypothetical protein